MESFHRKKPLLSLIGLFSDLLDQVNLTEPWSVACAQHVTWMGLTVGSILVPVRGENRAQGSTVCHAALYQPIPVCSLVYKGDNKKGAPGFEPGTS